MYMKLFSKFGKLPMEYYVVIFLLVVVIFMSMYCNNISYTPYVMMNTSLNPYPYEGFQSEVQEKKDSTTAGSLGTFEAEGLKAAPLDVPSIHDPVSKLKGSHECVGSSVYTNSSGGLCLTDDVKRAFDTRGGNR